MNFLMTRLGPLPVWVWGVAIIGGVVLFFVIKRFQSGNSGSTLGQNTAGQVNPLNPNNDPNIDPNTGVPYQIEEGIDPNTGLPYYFQLTGGATSQGQAGGGPGGSTNPIPVDQPISKVGLPTSPGFPGGPDPSTVPPSVPTGPRPAAAPWYASSLDAQGRTSPPQGATLNDVAKWYGISWADIAYNPNNKSILPGAYAAKGNEQLPAGTKLYIPTSRVPATSPHGTGAGSGIGSGDEWSYPYWAGQGGLLYSR